MYPVVRAIIVAVGLCAWMQASKAPPARADEANYTHLIIDADGPNWSTDYGMHVKTAGDINSDGYVDAVVAGSLAGEPLYWYAAPDWQRHTISTLGGWSTDAAVGDIDCDGDADVVVSVSYRADSGIEWFENAGPDAWIHHAIGSPWAHDIVLADLDLDGDLDMVTRQQETTGNLIELWRQDAGVTWTHRTLSGVVPAGEGLALGDLDRDGDADIIAGTQWLENTRDIAGSTWPAHVFTSAWKHPQTRAVAADINNDGRLDIVLTPSEPAGVTYHVSWFEAPSDSTSPEWVEHVVDANTECVLHSLQVIDVDLDGDLDIATAEMHQSSGEDEVRVYLNTGTPGTGGTWSRQVIGTTGSHQMQAGDFDHDGFPDLFGANWTGTRVVDTWHNELRAQREDFDLSGTVNGKDLAILEQCATGPAIRYDISKLPSGCAVVPDAQGIIPPDLDRDGDVDCVDFGILQQDLVVTGSPEP
jgi:hypothetical protein